MYTVYRMIVYRPLQLWTMNLILSWEDNYINYAFIPHPQSWIPGVTRCFSKNTCQICSLPVRGLTKNLIPLQITTCCDLFVPNRKPNLNPISLSNNITSQAPEHPQPIIKKKSSLHHGIAWAGSNSSLHPLLPAQHRCRIPLLSPRLLPLQLMQRGTSSCQGWNLLMPSGSGSVCTKDAGFPL